LHFHRSANRRLICKSFNYERKRVRRLDAGCINLLLGRRILKSLPRTPRNRGRFEHSSAISQRDRTGWLRQRRHPQLPTLTPAKIEEIWGEQSRREPWFRHSYAILNSGKDDPQFIDTLRKEIPCSETNAPTHDATFSPTAYQYQCSINASNGMTIVLFINFTSAYTLPSAVT
jgi:hypothetical protein